MKRLFFTAAAAALLCSCGKESVCEHTPAHDTQGAAVTLSFDAGSSRTKSFFDPTATAESWEKSLSSVCVLVFGADGRLLVQRNFTYSELSAKKATFAIPNALAGQNCDFYVVANKTVDGISGKAALMALSETIPAEYNGTFAEVSTKAKRSGGFVMTGHTTKAIAAQGTKTDVAVTLERTVAKIAVQASTTAEFSERYSGKVRINSVVLSKAASRSNLIAQQTPNTGPMTFTHTQAADELSGKFRNLFYVPENGELAEGSRLLLTLGATYDRDGNFSTTDDQAEVTYPVELSGDGAGRFLRNGYYRVQALIDGLTGSELSVSISVADWETPVTQSVNLGQ